MALLVRTSLLACVVVIILAVTVTVLEPYTVDPETVKGRLISHNAGADRSEFRLLIRLDLVSYVNSWT